MKQKNESQEAGKTDRDLVALAVKCKLISSEQENEILTCLFKHLQKQPEKDYSVLHVFEELNILSREDIDFLLSVKEHLETKLLDKKFAKFAIANHFTGPDDIQKAFNSQAAIFKKTGKTLSLGDILVKHKKMSEAECKALLLTQDRIRDEQLAETLNMLAATEFEKRAASKRFGSIAVKNGYVSMEKINQALKMQTEEKNKGLPARHIGEILEEAFDFPPAATLEILKEQKQYEKKRLDLEKALYRYNTEIKINQTLSKIFEFKVSQDKLEACIRINRNFAEEIQVYHLLNWVKLMGVQFGLADDDAINKFLVNGTKGSELKIAGGIPAQKGKPAFVEFCFDINADKGSLFVNKGAVLAKRIPHEEGIPGKNVFGQTIFPPQPDSCLLKKGNGVIEKNQVFIAEIDGSPVLYKQRTLFVLPLLQDKKTLNIPGDITPDFEDVYREVNLKVDGDILQGACLRCHKLEVDGNVLGDVKATGDVEIKGCAGGIPLGTDLSGHFPTIVANGNISVGKKAENARIMSNKIFQAVHADVITSVVAARHGMIIKNVYSDETRPSVLKIGKHANIELNRLKAAIVKKKNELREKKHLPEIEELQKLLHQQIQVQDEYREKQNVLTYLIKIVGNTGLETLDIRENEFDFFEASPKTVPAQGEIPYKISQETKAFRYLQGVLGKIEKESPKIQAALIHEMLEENMGFYKAAVSATQIMEKEISIRSGLIREETEREATEIKKIEKELDVLILKKEFLALNDEPFNIPDIPEIRIRNKLSQGTVIEGTGARRVIDKTIYGVKLKQIVHNNKPDIVIEGYFE